MATAGLNCAQHSATHSEPHSQQRAWHPSSVHGHVLPAAPHPCWPQQQHRADVCVRSHDGASSSICGASAACGSPLASCGPIGTHYGQQQHQHQQHQHQQQQQHRGSSCGAVGNRGLAAGSSSTWGAPSASAGSLGWNAASCFFSNYRLGEKMGAGSFGTVHRAVHVQTGASYAVKVLRKHPVQRGMQIDAIQREVETWQQAQHSKFVAKLEGLFEDEENAYIVQELCAGGTLHDRLDAKGSCSEQEAAVIMQGVLDLLVECHRRQICYGDLKPANIMFSTGLQVRAIDFGCSRNAHGRALTQTCGSPVYSAPEIAQQRYGVGVDVWSAGVLLYQMLTGRLPFWPKKTMQEVARLPAYEVLAGTRNNEVQFPRDLWADISPTAQDLVTSMLDRNPATRISAADALRHPWLCAMLGYTPTPSGDALAAANNVVEFSGRARGSPLRPATLSLSPSKGGSMSSPGPLSPQKGSPLRSMLSCELPPSALIADLQRAAVPALVPAAE